ncbi:MAG: NF038122 family metalloprotease [Burkholderiales bacterium]
MKKISFKPTMIAMALGLAALAPSANAVDFVFRDVSANGAMTAEQLAAFQTAASYWSSKLTDKVTIYIDIAFDALPQFVLGGTSSTFTTANYSTIRGAMVADAKSSLDASAVANLQTGPALSFYATQGDLTSRFDNDGSTNNTLLGLTTANAKALGLATNTSVSKPDANITFATGYAGDFVYTRAGGVPADKIDFITVAEHEIGHALGFVSGVDDIDYCAGANNVCGLPNSANRFEDDWWYEPLDLFRYSAKGQMDVRVGGTPYFSADGGSTGIEFFSTGETYGDGWQASHFGPNSNTLMRAFVGDGEFYDASYADLAAMDVIGWDVAAVPEPETYAMMLAGLGVVGWAARRRRATAAATA